MVHFVGAGPGAADLITVRGKSLIENADVIIYAGSLVNPELLKWAKKDCMIHNSAYMTLEEVIAVIVKAEEAARTTVRLHTGDPAIYGAIREQMDELEKRSIAYEVCPGVSSMFGAAASLRAEYTLPGVSQSVIITRAEGRTPVPQGESLRTLAGHGATMVLFLSSGLADKVKAELIAGGYAPETPTAVVYKATWPEERLIRTTIDGLPQAMKEEQIDKTALIVVGDVLGEFYDKSRLYDAAFTTEFRKGKRKKETDR
ncbi:MAG: precorrin-4 C(11)-methyltransferase [Clostridium sp.]|nr:precorrin-4 C(11)-methyltransferase [Clostridium sp.]